MPDFFRLVSEYFWVIALAFSAINYWKARRDALRTVGPEKASEAITYLRNFALAGALPWVIMGVGQLSGETPTVWHYFRPQDGSPFVLAWLAAVFAISCLFAWWVLLKSGAKKVVEFNLMAALGQHGAKSPSENMIKFFAVLGVLMFPLWVFTAVSMNTPLPK